MIEENHPRLSLVRQCALVEISRSSWYYRPVGESQANFRLMRLMDELHLSCPWYGSRQMARALRRMGHRVGRKRVRRLMRVMGLRSLAPRPNTSRRARGLAPPERPVLWICGRALRTGANPAGRVDSPCATPWRCTGAVHTFAPLAHELHSINNTILIKKEKTKTVQSGSI